MKKLIFMLILPALIFAAEQPATLEFMGGYMDILSHQGSFAGLRLTQPLNSWCAVGAETATGIDIQGDKKSGKVDFSRVHALIRVSKSIGLFEPYAIGKDITGENPENYSDSDSNWKNSKFETDLGMTWHAGVCTHFKSFVIGVETGGGTTGTGYIDYNLVVGYRFK